jgi:hypothetical protein
LKKQYAHPRAAGREQYELALDSEWLTTTLAEKISTIDWQQAVKDVERFLKPTEQKSLSLWGERFFLSKLDQLVQI